MNILLVEPSTNDPAQDCLITNLLKNNGHRVIKFSYPEDVSIKDTTGIDLIITRRKVSTTDWVELGSKLLQFNIPLIIFRCTDDVTLDSEHQFLWVGVKKSDPDFKAALLAKITELAPTQRTNNANVRASSAAGTAPKDPA